MNYGLPSQGGHSPPAKPDSVYPTMALAMGQVAHPLHLWAEGAVPPGQCQLVALVLQKAWLWVLRSLPSLPEPPFPCYLLLQDSICMCTPGSSPGECDCILTPSPSEGGCIPGNGSLSYRHRGSVTHR